MLNKKRISEASLDFQTVNKDNISLNLEYYLVESIYEDEEILNGKTKTYGIEILKIEKNNDTTNVENKVVQHLSTSREKVEGLLGILYKNTVTPIALENVLEDLIGVSY